MIIKIKKKIIIIFAIALFFVNYNQLETMEDKKLKNELIKKLTDLKNTIDKTKEEKEQKLSKERESVSCLSNQLAETENRLLSAEITLLEETYNSETIKFENEKKANEIELENLAIQKKNLEDLVTQKNQKLNSISHKIKQITNK